MLIIDRTQRTWAALSLVISLLAGGVYAVYATNAINGPSGGSIPGLAFGLIAAGMMIFAGLLAARRRFPAARLGSAQFWLRGHLWIGTLTVPFALFHAGFGWGGRLEWLLWGLFGAVVLSGFWGLALQQMLPRLMLEQIPRETFVEQLPYLCARFTAESDRNLANVCGPLDITLAPGDLQEFRPHLVGLFDEDRKKNRADYPRTTSEADQFQIFLAKIYASINISPVKVTPVKLSPASSVPEMVGSTTAIPASDVARSADDQPRTQQSTPAKADSIIRPDSTAMAAAMRTKQDVVATAAGVSPPVEHGTSPGIPADAPGTSYPVEVAGKPDPKAILAALKAKKEAAARSTDSNHLPSAEANPDSGSAPPTRTVAHSEPDPQAAQAAALVKTQTAATASQPAVTADEAHKGATGPTVSSAPIPAANANPKAMLAAMKARKEAAATGTASPAESPAAPTPSSASELKVSPLGQRGVLTSAMKLAPPTPEHLAELRQFYLEVIRPQFKLGPTSRTWMDAMRRATLACQVRQNSVHPLFIPIFNQLYDICEQRKQFAFIQRYHRWLHGWLMVHIPTTVALYVILAVHAVAALRVIPFGR